MDDELIASSFLVEEFTQSDFVAEVLTEIAGLCTEDLTASGFLVEECTSVRLRGQSACLVWLYG